MTNLIRYSASNDRVPSAAIWDRFNLNALREFGLGWMDDDDFMGDHDLTNAYTITQASAGTMALVDAKGGIADLDCASGTATQGVNVQRSSSVGERFSAVAAGRLAFECRFAVSDMTAGSTGPELFIGLHEIDTTIIGSSAMSGTNFIGLQSITDDGVCLSVQKKTTAETTTGVSLATSAAGIANATWYKFGFVVDGVSSTKFYVNGAQVGSTLTTYVPTALMVPSFVCQSDGTVDPILHLDWWRAAQIGEGYGV